MSLTWPRLFLALTAFPVWVAITVGGALLAHPRQDGFVRSIGTGPALQFLAAICFLFVVIRLAGWRDLALHLPRNRRSWLLLWLPALFLVLFFGLSAALGGPPAGMLFWAGVNTLLVGVSEELMFRGVLFRALLTTVSFRSAILIVTALFGAVHSLNVIVTGDLQLALLQCITAFMSGLLFVAITVRTGSLIPAILYHWLWDFGTFALIGASQTPAATVAAPSAWLYAMPTMLVLPNFLYALYLLRRPRTVGDPLARAGR